MWGLRIERVIRLAPKSKGTCSVELPPSSLQIVAHSSFFQVSLVFLVEMHNKVNKFECKNPDTKVNTVYMTMGTPITKTKCKYCPTAECQATQLLVLANNVILTQLIYYVSVLVRLAPQSTIKILVNYLYSKISGSYLA